MQYFNLYSLSSLNHTKLLGDKAHQANVLSFIIKAHSVTVIHVHMYTSVNCMMHYGHEDKYNIRASSNLL